MPLQLDIKKKLQTRSERVKSVCFHPTLPWVLSAVYNGHLIVYDWEEQATVRDIEACPSTAIRCARFVEHKQWIICGADDMQVRVFNYNSLEKVKQFEAHNDFIRHIAIHPTLPLLLTCSDDMSVRLWDWSKNWARIASFEAHMHYVMMAQWNPKDPHIFATASLDRTIKVWGISPGGSVPSFAVVTQPHFSLLGHESGVNALDYAATGEKPYIVSGGDDSTVRVWDYQTKQCVAVLSGHQGQVLCCAFHPTLPLVISGGEDGTIMLWHSITNRREMVLKYAMGRVWEIASTASINTVAFATDEGTVVAKLGTDRAVASMHGGKIILARALEVQTTNVRLVDDTLFGDGERLPLPLKELGSCDVFAQRIAHHPNGRLVAVCGDGEYIVYTAQALRNKAYGKAVSFAWSHEGDYAIRNDSNRITVFKNFQEHGSFLPAFPVEELFGGRLLGITGEDFICFYDWEELRLIRKIDLAPHAVSWNETGTAVVLACQESFYCLRFDLDAVVAHLPHAGDDGIESAFEFEQEIDERVESAIWLSGSFIYTTSRLRLQMLTAGVVETIAFLDRPAWLLGYMAEVNRLYLIDREYTVISYKLNLALVEYQAAVSREDFDNAAKIFPRIPEELHDRLGRFLEGKGYKEMALNITKDPDHKFDLALSLGRLALCTEILQLKTVTTDTQIQWQQLGDVALEQGAIPLAVASYRNANDVESGLMIASSIGDSDAVRRLSDVAAQKGKINVAFVCNWLTKNVDKCVDILIERDDVPEAALFARNYARHRLPEVMAIWRRKLTESGRKQLAEALLELPVESC